MDLETAASQLHPGRSDSQTAHLVSVTKHRRAAPVGGHKDLKSLPAVPAAAAVTAAVPAAAAATTGAAVPAVAEPCSAAAVGRHGELVG